MDFEKFEAWVLKDIGINLSAYKSNQLHRRISSLMTRIGVTTADEYIALLKRDLSERQRFLDFITINVSEFFRNPEMFDELSKLMKSEVLKNNKNLRVWSAACSIGAEPYSLAMILDDYAPKSRSYLLATDIDNTIINKAKMGEYSNSEVRNVKKDYMNKYFTLKNDKYFIDNKIKNMVTFKKHDLILDRYENDFDIIVCRNVVIYFNTDIKNEIYKKFSNSLKSGGLLFVGATESIYNYKEYGFEKASTFIYRKL
ncbi:CheR family methyltransferase [Clostridium hydrogeniformans]|uniref:CheR family methyltransferase n=1 Tax=Clostridium hydrogeniformans TaxID=349933 RepID=UPI000483A914|nr:protein-glutamate O-methyltransferase CheR [Clostridium hydrogeniformans]